MVLPWEPSRSYVCPVNSTGPAPGSQASLREMNRLRVLDAVRENGALTQVEIAGVTGLSAATVSNLVKELDAAGAVQLSPSVAAILWRGPSVLDVPCCGSTSTAL